MGVERVLQVAGSLALAAVALVATTATAAPRERVAVFDLGPSDAAVRQKLAAAIVAGGLEPVLGDGVEDALGGQSTEPDELQLAVAIGDAQRAFGALDCPATIVASQTAIGIAAARQAAGRAVPELTRAWTYRLLCADRMGDSDAAMTATARLRALGPRPAEVPLDVWTRYPEVDAVLDHDMVPLEIKAEVPGAAIWIDFQRVGTSPLKTHVRAGEHVIAASAGTRRGWAAGTAVRTQTTITVPMPEQRGAYAALAQRVASWRGTLPAPAELGEALLAVNARVAIVRRGDQIQAWGRVGRSEPPRLLGGEDGTGELADAPRLVAVIADRVQTWADRAPDPDQPLLLEDPKLRGGKDRVDEPTKWWVYATILGAVVGGATLLYLHDSASNTQHVELHYP
ncbi:MAG: hypothetical protein JWP01_291 [Myxococcales bacterium]|nr:hypothetical protein [Myxococcales bacterium]